MNGLICVQVGALATSIINGKQCLTYVTRLPSLMSRFYNFMILSVDFSLKPEDFCQQHKIVIMPPMLMKWFEPFSSLSFPKAF